MKDNYDISALKKKKKVNSKAKGSSFERQVAKILNDRLGTTLAIIPSNVVVQSNNYIEIHKEGIHYSVYMFDDLLKEEDSIWMI
jgi:CRISPR/Cas system CMR-associated protein Cmr5 small subunit